MRRKLTTASLMLAGLGLLQTAPSAWADYTVGVTVPGYSETTVVRSDAAAAPNTFLRITNQASQSWVGTVSWTDGREYGYPPPGYQLMDTTLTISQTNPSWPGFGRYGRGIGFFLTNLVNRALSASTLVIMSQGSSNVYVPGWSTATTGRPLRLDGAMEWPPVLGHYGVASNYAWAIVDAPAGVGTNSYVLAGARAGYSTSVVVPPHSLTNVIRWQPPEMTNTGVQFTNWGSTAWTGTVTWVDGPVSGFTTLGGYTLLDTTLTITRSAPLGTPLMDYLIAKRKIYYDQLTVSNAQMDPKLLLIMRSTDGLSWLPWYATQSTNSLVYPFPPYYGDEYPPILGHYGVDTNNHFAWAVVNATNTGIRSAYYVLAGARAIYQTNVTVTPNSDVTVERLDAAALPNTFLKILNPDTSQTWTGTVSWVDGPVTGTTSPGGYVLGDTTLTINQLNTLPSGPPVYGRGIGYNPTTWQPYLNNLVIMKRQGWTNIWKPGCIILSQPCHPPIYGPVVWPPFPWPPYPVPGDNGVDLTDQYAWAIVNEPSTPGNASYVLGGAEEVHSTSVSVPAGTDLTVARPGYETTTFVKIWNPCPDPPGPVWSGTISWVKGPPTDPPPPAAYQLQDVTLTITPDGWYPGCILVGRARALDGITGPAAETALVTSLGQASWVPGYTTVQAGRPVRFDTPMESALVAGHYGVDQADGYAWAVVDALNYGSASYVLASAQAGYSQNVAVTPHSGVTVVRADNPAITNTSLLISNQNYYDTWSGTVSWADGPVTGTTPAGYLLDNTVLRISLPTKPLNVVSNILYVRRIILPKTTSTGAEIDPKTAVIMQSKDGQSWLPGYSTVQMPNPYTNQPIYGPVEPTPILGHYGVDLTNAQPYAWAVVDMPNSNVRNAYYVVAGKELPSPTLWIARTNHLWMLWWDPERTGWILQAQTNGLGSQWHEYPEQPPSNQITITPSERSVFYRLVR